MMFGEMALKKQVFIHTKYIPSNGNEKSQTALCDDTFSPMSTTK
jgi:hypothetical protein